MKLNRVFRILDDIVRKSPSVLANWDIHRRETRVLLLIDNYDSFVFNLARYVRELGVETRVVRHDAMSVAEVANLQPQAIILSPGPCSPNEAGICIELIRTLASKVPILGVCLGHQAIGAALGGQVIRAPQPVHGSTSEILHDGKGLFAGCPQPLIATRYHSLIVDTATLPHELQVTARTADGLIMGMAHRRDPLFGVQFHPESILTQAGHQLLANFLRIAGWHTTRELPSGDLHRPAANPNDFFAAPIDPSAARPS